MASKDELKIRIKLISITLCFAYILINTDVIAKQTFNQKARNIDNRTYISCNATKYMLFGKQGWIFEPWEFGGSYDASSIPDLIDMNNALKKRGVSLIFVPVPNRSYKYSGQIDLSLYPDTKFSVQDYKMKWQAMVDSVQKNGVSIVNLLPVIDSYETSSLGETFFYPRDHHWTTSGARVSALVVARTVIDLAKVRKLNLSKQQGTLIVVRQGFNSGSFGDKYTSLCHTETEHMPAYQATNKVTGNLLDNSKIGIAVMGDSFGLASPDNNFSTFVESATGLATINYSLPGEGTFSSMTGYLASSDFVKNIPSFIIVPLLSWLPNDPISYRQITAEVNGCVSQISQTLYSKNTSLIDFTPRLSKNTLRNMIHIAYDKPQTQVKLALNYAGGDSEQIELHRSNSNFYKGDKNNFYMTIPKDKVLNSANIQTESKAQSGVKIEFCAMEK